MATSRRSSRRMSATTPRRDLDHFASLIQTPVTPSIGRQHGFSVQVPSTGRRSTRADPPLTPHALRALQQRATARTPGRGKDRRKSLRVERETPIDVLLNLGRKLAPTTRPIVTSSASSASSRSTSPSSSSELDTGASPVPTATRRGKATTARAHAGRRSRPSSAASSDPEPERPRLSLPMAEMGAVGEHEANAQGGQQDASPDLQPPPRLSLVPFGGNAEEYDEPDLDLTVRSIELPRERPNRPRLSMFPRISIGPDALEDLDMDSGVARGGARAMYDGGDDYDGKDDDDDDDGGGGTGIVLPGDGLPGDETENLNRFQLDFSFPTPEAADTVLEETAATAALAADDHDFQLEPVRTRTQAAAAQPFVSSDATLPEPAAQDANSRQPGSLRSSTSASFFRPPASGPPSAEFVISRDRKFHFDSDASLSDPAVQDDLANRRAGHPDLRFRNQRDDAHGSGMPEPRGAAPPMGYFSLPRVVSSPARPSPRPRPRSQHKHAPGSDATLSDPATRRDQPAEHVPSDRLADRSDYGTARAGALPPVGTFYIGRPPPGPRGAVPDLQGRTLTDPAMQFAYADYAQQPQPYPYAAIRHDMRYDDPNLSPLRDIPEPNGPYLSSEPDGSYLSPLRDIPEPYGPYLSSLEDVPDSDGPGPLPFSDVPEPDEPSDGVASAEKTQAPKLPSSTVKKIAMRSTRGGKLNKGTVDVLSQATAWFFEQMSADLAAFADHAGRKVIDESDVVTLMRRQRLIGPQTSVFALAKKHLPQELVQEIRLPARRRLKRG